VNVLLDTNVVLDVLLEREPHHQSAVALFALVDSGRVRGMVCATTITTVFYLAAKVLGQRAARAHVATLLSIFDTAAVTGAALDSALDLTFDDYEDAVIHEAARLAGADLIVTRDANGFRHASVPSVSPGEALAMIMATT
jgi:predicted nucleic acid-binding protein